MFHWFVVILVLLPLILIIKNFIINTPSAAVEYICPHCGSQNPPKKTYRGSIFIEIVLWLCFIIPGLIYSIWRQTSTYTSCQNCGQAGVIPLDTPNGKLLAEKFNLKN